MMMDMESVDKELLYVCAKAMGYEIIGYHPKTGLRVWNEDHTHGFKWNPLYDDGDAFRLAVKCQFEIKVENYMTRVFPQWEEEALAVVEFKSTNGDELAATRRAIVIAATELSQKGNA